VRAYGLGIVRNSVTESVDTIPIPTKSPFCHIIKTIPIAQNIGTEKIFFAIIVYDIYEPAQSLWSIDRKDTFILRSFWYIPISYTHCISHKMEII